MNTKQKQVLRVTPSSIVFVLKASILVANHIAKAKKPSTTGDELILSTTKEISCVLSGESEVQKMAWVLSMVTRKIDAILRCNC